MGRWGGCGDRAGPRHFCIYIFLLFFPLNYLNILPIQKINLKDY